MMFLIMTSPNGAFAESSLGNDTLEKINNAVFEVVVLKPTKDSLTYEHPLPMHLIPYSIRTDKYYSIGTAFAISPKEFITAAHVMNLGTASQFKEICLRDKDGNVFEIDKIMKYSEQRDYAVFSLKDKALNDFFKVNTTPRINQKVYAVGNALGEGIVARDGLYTSSTLEAEEGAWKWIRFSAAASPGNSGGPLLDAEGRVIGIVLQKSPGENLNIALPIAEVLNAKVNLAVAHRIFKYTLENMPMAKLPTFNKEISLPKSYHELNLELIDGMNLLYYKTTKDLFRSNRNVMFPIGRGSYIMLHSSYDSAFPLLIAQNNDRNWYASNPNEIKEAELLNNGQLRYGQTGNTFFLRVQKPDDISLETFYSDSKIFMDLILKGMYLSRQIGSEKVRITSLGKASETDVFTDSYGRIWQIKCWNLEYNDEKVVTFSLPVPGGCITLMREGQTGLVNTGHIPDLKILTNFIYFTYKGTLKNWREFLTMKALLPPGLSGLNITFDYNREFHYDSKRFSFSLTPDYMRIDEKSFLHLSFDYFKENGETVWDVGTVSVGENYSTFINIRRKTKPSIELSSDLRRDWENADAQLFPYNRLPYPDDKATLIATALKKMDGKPSMELYIAAYGQGGKVEQPEMSGKLDHLLRNLTIHEYAEGTDVTSYTRKDTYHDKGEYFQALWEKDRLSEMQPETADGYILRGNIYQDKGDTGRAILNFDKAIALCPENAEGYYNRGAAFIGNGKTELALADYSKAVELNPRHAEAYCYRGGIYRSMGNHDRSISDCSKAIELTPQYTAAYICRGVGYGNKGKLDLAITDFNKVLDLDSNNAEAFNNRGFAYKVKGDLARALEDFDRSIESNPFFTLAYINRGNAYAVEKNKFKACSDWVKACEQGTCSNYLNAKKARYCD